MSKIILIITIWLLTVTPTFSQKIDSTGNISREKSSSVLCQINIKSNNYLLFSISDRWYLIIKDCGNYYVEYYINVLPFNSSELKIKSLRINKPNKILSQAFDKKIYYKNYITFDSPFFKNKELTSEGNTTYFFLSEKGRKFGEARLSVFIKPNPINEDVYNYLKINLLKFIQE